MEPQEMDNILGENRSMAWRAVDPSCPPHIAARITEIRKAWIDGGQEAAEKRATELGRTVVGLRYTAPAAPVVETAPVVKDDTAALDTSARRRSLLNSILN